MCCSHVLMWKLKLVLLWYLMWLNIYANFTWSILWIMWLFTQFTLLNVMYYTMWCTTPYHVLSAWDCVSLYCFIYLKKENIAAYLVWISSCESPLRPNCLVVCISMSNVFWMAMGMKITNRHHIWMCIH